MKILCVYFNNDEFDYLSQDPETEFSEHMVTVATSYDAARDAINDSSRGIPPFDVILTDLVMPCCGLFKVPAGLLFIPHIDVRLIRGLGIFVSRQVGSATLDLDGYQTVIASDECWTPTGKRDWPKLLELVNEQIMRLQQ